MILPASRSSRCGRPAASFPAAGERESSPCPCTDALRTGFFLVKGHRLPEDVLDGVFEAWLQTQQFELRMADRKQTENQILFAWAPFQRLESQEVAKEFFKLPVDKKLKHTSFLSVD